MFLVVRVCPLTRGKWGSLLRGGKGGGGSQNVPNCTTAYLGQSQSLSVSPKICRISMMRMFITVRDTHTYCLFTMVREHSLFQFSNHVDNT